MAIPFEQPYDIYQENPQMQPIDFDECECGDFRHQHADGLGGCNICKFSNHLVPKCDDFRLAKISDMGWDKK